MSSMAQGAKAAASALRSDRAKSIFSNIRKSKSMQRLGKLGGGRLGKLGGRLGGLLGGATDLLAGSQTPEPNTQQPDHTDQPAQPAQKKPSLFKGLFKRMMTGAGTVAAGQRAWNDTEGTGLRSGDWRTRRAEMEARDAEKQANSSQDTANVIDQAVGNSKGMSGLFKTLTDRFKGLFGQAQGTLGGLADAAADAADIATGGIGGTVAGKKKGLLRRGLGKLGKGIGAVGSVGVKGLEKIGVTKLAKKLGYKSLAGFAARHAGKTALLGAADLALTGGLGSSLLAGASIAMSGLAAVLSSPVVIGSLAIGAIAYGGYKAYKHLTRDKMDDFQKIRFMQYGFGNPNTEKYNHLVANLENYLLDGKVGYQSVDQTTSKKAYVLDKNVNIEELVKMFDIDPHNETDVYKFTEWLEGRFKPFFIHNATAAYNIDPKIYIDKLSKMEVDDQVKFLKATRYDNGPYDFTDSPITDIDALPSNKDEVIKEIDDLTIRIKKDKKKSDERRDKVRSVVSKLKNASDRTLEFFHLKKTPEQLEGERRLAAAQAKINAKHKIAHEQKLEEIRKKASDREGLSKVKDAISIDSEAENAKLGQGPSSIPLKDETIQVSGSMKGIPPLASGALSSGSEGMKYVKLANQSVNIDSLNPSVRKNFLSMAEEYGKLTGNQIQVNSAFRSFQQQQEEYDKDPSKAAKPGNSLHNFGLALDVNTNNLDELEKLGLMRKYGFTRPIFGETWHTEPAGIQSSIEKAKNDTGLASQMTDASILKGGGGPGVEHGHEKERHRRDHAMQMKLLNIDSQPTDNLNKTTNDNIADKLTTTATVTATRPASNDSDVQTSKVKSSVMTPPPASPMTAMSQNKPYSYTQNGKFSLDISPPEPEYQNTSRQQDDGEVEKPPASDSESTDHSVTNDFPMDREGILKAIDTHAKKVNVPGKHLQVFAALESSLDPQAKAGTSSAEGLFQFTNTTWSESMQKYGKKNGLKGDEPKQNVKASTILAGEYMKTNLQTVKKAVPRPGLVEAYLAHFLGAEGAKKFMSTNPDAIGAMVFPKPAISNREIFFEGRKPRTIKEIYTYVANKVERTAKAFGITGVTVSKSFPSETGQTTTSRSDANISGGQAAMTNVTPPVSTKSEVSSPVNGDYQQIALRSQSPIVRAPREIAAPTPSFTSNRTTDTRVEMGDSPMKELVAVASNSMTIHQKSLETVMEIRDLIKSFVAAKGTGAQQPQISNNSQRPSSREVINPIVNIGRVRSSST